MTGIMPESAVVQLWLLPTKGEPRQQFVARSEEILIKEERNAATAAARPELAERLVSSRILLRLALADQLGCCPDELRFSRRDSGRLDLVKPVAPNIHFSLSHTGSESVVAVSTVGPVGVDLETTRRAGTALRIARSFFGEEEAVRIEESATPAQTALQHWTLKESMVKALGRTIWIGLGRYGFAIDGTAAHLQEPFDEDPRCWQFMLGSLRDAYVLAVALRIPVGTKCTADFRLRIPDGGTAYGEFQDLSVSSGPL